MVQVDLPSKITDQNGVMNYDNSQFCATLGFTEPKEEGLYEANLGPSVRCSEHAKLLRFVLLHLGGVMSFEEKLCMDEALLKEPANQPALKNQDGRWPSLLTVVGFVFLTFNSTMAVYRSNGDMGSISFVIFSYLDLVVLFCCLRQFERAPPESPRREHIKMVVWLLTTILTAAFSYKVAEIMPLLLQVLVWAMAGVTVFGGFLRTMCVQ